MTPRKTIFRLLVSTSLTAALALPAAAQGRGFSEIDSNGDGVLSRAELEATFGSRGASRILNRGDANRDGVISLSEARSSARDDDDEDDLS